MLDALRSRLFRRVAAAFGISNLGDWLYFPAVVAYIYELTQSHTWIGVSSALRTLPFIFLASLAGDLVDRFDKRTVMVSSNLLRFCAMAGLVAAVITGAPFWVLLTLIAAEALFSLPDRPALSAATPRLVPEPDLASANTTISVLDSAALVLGPSLGGALLLFTQTWAVLSINAMTFLVAAALLSGLPNLKIEGDGSAHVPPRILERFAEGIRSIGEETRVRALIYLSPLLTLIPGTAFVYLTLVATEHLNRSSESLGFLLASWGGGSLLAGGFAPRLVNAVAPMKLVLGTTFVEASAYTALALLRADVPVFVLAALVGGAGLVLEVATVTYLQRLLPEELSGRVFGLFEGLLYLGVFAGALLAPLLLRITGLPGAVAITSGLTILVSTIVVRGLGGWRLAHSQS
ncbi:MAG: MFS transporter [Actinomycetota bacterium]|nr:MFS transporter [Actinomycetota bacterium]